MSPIITIIKSFFSADGMIIKSQGQRTYSVRAYLIVYIQFLYVAQNKFLVTDDIQRSSYCKCECTSSDISIAQTLITYIIYSYFMNNGAIVIEEQFLSNGIKGIILFIITNKDNILLMCWLYIDISIEEKH